MSETHRSEKLQTKRKEPITLHADFPLIALAAENYRKRLEPGIEGNVTLGEATIPQDHDLKKCAVTLSLTRSSSSLRLTGEFSAPDSTGLYISDDSVQAMIDNLKKEGFSVDIVFDDYKRRHLVFVSSEGTNATVNLGWADEDSRIEGITTGINGLGFIQNKDIAIPRALAEKPPSEIKFITVPLTGRNANESSHPKQVEALISTLNTGMNALLVARNPGVDIPPIDIQLDPLKPMTLK
jgi:hypothetical protein